MSRNLAVLTGAIDNALGPLDLEDRIAAINELRAAIAAHSPFSTEPVDFVRWIKNDAVYANDYNPNSVAPPEMELLRVSIEADGYTQPIVSMPDEKGGYEVIDGFHRHRVGKELDSVRARVHGYLPLVCIRTSQYDKSTRIASTIRHNRARGKHKVDAMSDIVLELKRRNWSDEKICKNLGMDQDEVLRLCQISGLSDIFAGQEFSPAWEPEGAISLDDFADLSGAAEDYDVATDETRTANVDDPARIFHTYDLWECHKAGFYESKPPAGMTADNCRARLIKFMVGWFRRGYSEIPQEAPPHLEAKQWAPSWRRMAKCLLRNDYWCKGLGQTQPKSAAWVRFKEMKKNSKAETVEKIEQLELAA
jgi:ParB-like chromosome segregation protein Spo0J